MAAHPAQVPFWHARCCLSIASAFDHASDQLAVGQLAVRLGSTPRVREMGQQLVDDGATALSRLNDVVAKDGLALPSGRSPGAERNDATLASLRGTQFDRAFLDYVRTSNDAAFWTFEREAKVGNNADLRAYAADGVAVIDGQLTGIKMGVAEMQKSSTSAR